MKKTIILIPVIFLLVISIISAAEISPCFLDNNSLPSAGSFLMKDDFNGSSLDTSLWAEEGTTATVSNGTVVLDGGAPWGNYIGSNPAHLANGQLPLFNVTIEMRFKLLWSSDNINLISVSTVGCAGSTNGTGCNFDDGVVKAEDDAGYNTNYMAQEWHGTPSYGNWVCGNGLLTVGDWHNFSLYFNNSGNATLYLEDGTSCSNQSVGSDSGDRYNGYFGIGSAWAANDVEIDWAYAYNGTVCPTSVDTTSPVITNNATNGTSTTATGEDVHFNATCTDETAGGSMVFGFDDGAGTFTNDTAVSWSTPYNFMVNKTITATRGETVNGRFYCNDSSNNWAESTDLSFVVADTAITTPSISSPADGDHDTKQLNAVFTVTDPDPDTIHCTLNGSGGITTITNSSVTSGGQVTLTTTGMVSETIYTYNVTCCSFDCQAVNGRTYVYDATLPTITLVAGGFLADNSSFYSTPNLPINITFADIYLFQAHINVTDLNGVDKWSWTALDLNATSYNKNETIDMTGWSDGNYTIKVQATDDNTDKEIEDYAVTKEDKVDKKSLQYFTTEKNLITVQSLNKDKVKEFSTTKEKDRYTFEYEFKSNDGVLTFIVSSDKKLYFDMRRGYPKFNVWNPETERGNWIDFNAGLRKSEYVVDKINDYEYRVYIITEKLSVTFNSIGGTNTVTKWYKVGVDLNAPAIDYAGGTLTNATWYSQDWVFVNISVSDVNLDSVVFNWNGVNESFDSLNMYQENSNKNSTLGIWTGSPNEVSNVMDGDWDSYSQCKTSGSQCFVYINYTKPNNSTDSSLWQVKDENGVFNLTINSNCWSQNRLQFRADSDKINNKNYWRCYNSSSWVVLRQYTDLTPLIYEEAMWWSVTTNYYENKTGLTDGNYTFYAYANDAFGNEKTTGTREVYLDTLNPTIEYTGGTLNSSTYYNQDWIYVNVSVTETNFKNITFYLNTTNETSYTTETFEHNFTGLSDGNFTFNVTVYDLALNKNSTATRSGIVLDTTYPSITYAGGTLSNATWYSQDWIYVNVSATDTNLGDVTFEWNGVNESLDNNYYENQTGLADGNYTFRVFVNDSVGLENETTLREVYLDTTYPSIDFSTGTTANNTWVNRTWLYADITLTETNFANMSYYLTNTSFINETNHSTKISNINFTGLTEGTYYYNVTVTDKADNTNYTATRILNFDFYAPSITNIINHSANGSTIIYNNEDAYLNATITDTHLGTVLVSGNWTGNWVNYSMSNTGSNYYYLIDDTNLIEDTYASWFVIANDSAGFFTITDTQRFYVTDSGVYNPESFSINDSGTLTYAVGGSNHFNLTLPKYSTIKTALMNLTNQSVGVKNITVNVDGIQVYENLTQLNTTYPMNNINLNNASVLQNCVDEMVTIIDEDVICGVNITTITAGGIKYTYNITYYPYRMSYTSPTIEGSYEPYALMFNYNTTFNYTADLYLNNTLHSVTRTIDPINNFTSFNTSFYVPMVNNPITKLSVLWRYTKVFPTTTQNYGTDFENQTIYQIYIDECGGKTNDTTLNATFKDDVNGNLINVDFDAYFKVWKNNTNYYRNFTFNATGITNYSWCIYPNWTSYASDYEIAYDLTGYDFNTYIKNFQLLTNLTTNIALYMTSTGNSTEITINVVDEFGDPLFEKVVEAWRYKLVTNSYTLASTGETDEEGVIKFNLYLGDDKFRFIIKDPDGTTIYTSATMKLYEIEYTFTIRPEITNEYEGVLTGITRTLTVSETSPYSISYTWAYPSGIASQICLRVTNSTLRNTTILYDACSTSLTGTLSTTLTTTAGHYPVIGYAISPTDERYVLDTDLIEIRTAFDTFDTEGMLYAGIFIGTMSFLGLGVAMVSTAGGIISIMLLIFSSIVMMVMGLMNIGVGGIMFLVIMGIAVIIIISRD